MAAFYYHLEIMGELVDLVDACGRTRVAAVPIEQAHEYYSAGLHLQIAIAVVLRGRELLVQQRAYRKRSDRGLIDHVCGVVSSGESPDQTAIRECLEETTIAIGGLSHIHAGVNSYGRYRHLFLAEAPTHSNVNVLDLDLREVEWADFVEERELRDWQNHGPYGFVDEFFADLQAATNL